MFQISLGKRIHRSVRRNDIPYLHYLIAFQRNRNYVTAVKISAEDSGRDRVSVQSDKKIKERCPVRDHNVFRAFRRDMQFLRKIKRILYPLIICQAGIILQVLKSDRFASHQRIVPADEHMRRSLKQRFKFQFLILQDMTYHLAVEFAQIQHTYVAAVSTDILDNLSRL